MAAEAAITSTTAAAKPGQIAIVRRAAKSPEGRSCKHAADGVGKLEGGCGEKDLKIEGEKEGKRCER